MQFDQEKAAQLTRKHDMAVAEGKLAQLRGEEVHHGSLLKDTARMTEADTKVEQANEDVSAGKFRIDELKNQLLTVMDGVVAFREWAAGKIEDAVDNI